jgi:hypothetical protein
MPTPLPPSRHVPQEVLPGASWATSHPVIAIVRHSLAYVLLTAGAWALGTGLFLYKRQIITRANLRIAASAARFCERTACKLVRYRKSGAEK